MLNTPSLKLNANKPESEPSEKYKCQRVSNAILKSELRTNEKEHGNAKKAKKKQWQCQTLIVKSGNWFTNRAGFEVTGASGFEQQAK